MKQAARPILTSLALAAFFTFLFHDTGIGLNLLLFELALFASHLFLRRVKWTPPVILSVSGVFATAAAVVWHGSSMAIFCNLLFGVAAVGVLMAPELRALHHSLVLGGWNVLAAQRGFLRAVPWSSVGSNSTQDLPRAALTTASVPLIVLLFGVMYSASNPY